MKQFFILTFVVFFGNGYSQSRSIDSLKTLINNTKEDTNTVKLLNQLCIEYRNISNLERSIFYGLKALKIVEKIVPETVKGLCSVNNNIAISYYYSGEYSKALTYFDEALKYGKRAGDQKRIAGILGKIGSVYKSQTKYSKALQYYFDALKVAEETMDQKGQVTHLSNIAAAYSEQGQNGKALEYELKALKISESIEDKYGTAVLYSNMGVTYHANKNTQKALQCYFKAVGLAIEINNGVILSSSYGNIGSIYGEEKKYDSANVYFLKGLKIAEVVNDKNVMAVGYGNVASVFQAQKKFAEAERYYIKALNLDSVTGYLNHSLVMHQMLSELYSEKGDYRRSLLQYKNYSSQKDSLFNSSKNKELAKHELNYEFEKKEAAAKAEQDKKDAVAFATSQKQKLILTLISCTLFLVIVFAAFIVRTLHTTKKQKVLIELKNKETEEQKSIIEEKNKEVMDSIHYAKRIQTALLPTEKYIQRVLEEKDE